MLTTEKEVVEKAEKRHSLKEVYEMHFEDYLVSPSRSLKLEKKHFEAVDWSMACRSDKLGMAMLVCEGCGDVDLLRQSCKHRFCATCGVADTYKWAERMFPRLLNMKHHHITMTLPKEYRGMSKKNGDKLHNLLFVSSREVIKEWFAEHHNLRVGIVSVLHTAGSDLKYHPHVHMIVSRGGQDLSSGEYRELGGDYLVDQEVFGLSLKRKFAKLLIGLYKKGEIEVYQNIKDLAGLEYWIRTRKSRHWIVDIQDSLRDVRDIIGYVGRYTKRACISEYKIIYVGEDGVKFKYKDYRKGGRQGKVPESIKAVSGVAFLDLLLQHVPNKRYRMVRYSGLYNSYYLKDLPSAWLMKVEEKEEVEFEEKDWGVFEDYRKAVIREHGKDPLLCQYCNCEKRYYGLLIKGKLHRLEKDGDFTIHDYADSS